MQFIKLPVFKLLLITSIIGFVSCGKSPSKTDKIKYLNIINRPLQCGAQDMDNAMTRVLNICNDTTDFNDSSYQKKINKLEAQLKVGLKNIEISKLELLNTNDVDPEFQMKQEVLDLLDSLTQFHQKTLTEAIKKLKMGNKDPLIKIEVMQARDNNINQCQKLIEIRDKFANKHQIQKAEWKALFDCEWVRK